MSLSDGKQTTVGATTEDQNFSDSVIGKMYVDATELGNEKQFLDLELSDTSRDLTIGSAGNNGGHFNGLIDEVAIFSVALQEADIKTVMERGLLPRFGANKGYIDSTQKSLESLCAVV